jgi:hypothetical protein
MVVSSAYLGFPGLGLEMSGISSRTHPHVVSGRIVSYVLWVEPRALEVVGVSGAPSYGVMLVSA